jgi:membrane protease YdiL (CAAX protease family)
MLEFVLSALVNVLVLGGVPLLAYFVYHRRRHKRSGEEILARAGLTLGEFRYLAYCAVFSALGVAAFLLWRPSVVALTREGSAWRAFFDVGLGAKGISMALVYGIVKTGFPEELLFRGLIAGSLSRRFALPWANLLQALVFLSPHLLLLFLMPEMWPLVTCVFLGSLFVGWARIRSGSILGPWLAHACLNVTTGLYVAGASAGLSS